MLVELTAGDPRWVSALPVLQELRPHLTPQLLDQVIGEGATQGLRFTALFEEKECVAVAGWRIIANTSAIRKLYVDDLCTSSQVRAQGHGSTLLNVLIQMAKENECSRIELDSGVQRFEAHRFYLRERMNIDAHHFSLRL